MVQPTSSLIDFTSLVLEFYGLSDLMPIEYSEVGSGELAFGGLTIAQEEEETGLASESLSSATALLQQDRDPLGLSDVNYRREAKIDPGRIMTTSTAFDPKIYLAKVHNESTLKDLQKGKENLAKEIAARDATIKELVRQNFARFVNAKNSIDSVYADMQDKGLANPSDPFFGIKPALDKITAAYNRALQIFQPLVKRTEEEAVLKRRLDFLSRYQGSIFSVGKKLREAWQSGDFTGAVHEYRRGRIVLNELRGATQAEQEALRRFWQGQVEPEAERVRQAIQSQLIGDSAGWGRTFDDYARLITMYKVFDASTSGDPPGMWLSDYTKRLLEELERYQAITAVSIGTTIMQWRDDYKGDSIEGGLTRSILVILRSGTSLTESLPKLDFLCTALWTERQVFFEGTALIIGRMLNVLGEATSSPEPVVESSDKNLTEFCDQFRNRLPSYTQDLLSNTDTPIIDSAVISLLAAHRALLSLTIPLHRYFITGGTETILSKTVEDTLMSTCKVLLRYSWNTALVECRRVPRWEDWRIDAADYSTAVMRALEGLLLHLIDGTGRIMRLLQKVRG